MCVHSKNSKIAQKGAVMLEFAVAGLLFIFVLGFLFDIMIVYFKNQVLVTTVTRGTRAMAINFPQGFFLRDFILETQESEDRLNDLSDDIKAQFITHINNNFITVNDDAQNPPIAVNVQIERDNPLLTDQRIGDVVLRVDAEWRNVCIFCFFPRLSARATSQAIIEDECFFAPPQQVIPPPGG
jgi:hypothetical protein